MHPTNQIPIPELFVSVEAAGKLAEQAAKLPAWVMTVQQLGDLELLLNGGFFPLKGFMTRADAEAVQAGLRLTSGAYWPVPITLEVAETFAAQIGEGEDIALLDGQGSVLAIMSVTDLWRPGQADRVCLGGKVKGLRPPQDAAPGSPNRLRRLFRDRDWQQVLAWYGGDLPLQGEYALLGLSMPGAKLDPAAFRNPARAHLASLNLILRGDPLLQTMLQGLVARNHGATHVLATDPVLRRAFDSVGLVSLPEAEAE